MCKRIVPALSVLVLMASKPGWAEIDYHGLARLITDPLARLEAWIAGLAVGLAYVLGLALLSAWIIFSLRFLRQRRQLSGPGDEPSQGQIPARIGWSLTLAPFGFLSALLLLALPNFLLNPRLFFLRYQVATLGKVLLWWMGLPALAVLLLRPQTRPRLQTPALIVGFLCVAMAVWIWPHLPADATMGDRGNNAACATRLHRVEEGLIHYSASHGGHFPVDLKSIFTSGSPNCPMGPPYVYRTNNDASGCRLTCPANHHHFWFTSAPESGSDTSIDLGL